MLCNGAVSWVRIEHCASPDPNSYKAARAQTLSASQLKFVSWGSVMGQNEWGIKMWMGKDCSRLVEFQKGSIPSYCVVRLYQLTILLSDQRAHVAFICHWNKENTVCHKVNKL